MPVDLAAAVAAATRRAVMPLDVRWTASLPSTMDAAADAARAGAPEGYVIGADRQTAGRGRRGRTWESPPGAGLYLSLVLRPPSGDARMLALLTLAIGVGVRRAVAHATGLAPDLKWPNDVVIGGRKLAGILAEGHGVATDAQAVVVGIGINLLRAPMHPDVSPLVTSLEDELGRGISRAAVLEAVLVDVTAVYDDLRRGGADGILGEWLRAAPSASGATVEWDVPGGTQCGVTVGVDRDGALLVRTPASVERVIGGALRWG
jgi:BirA family biotin operon repressor/biotin-[acetyl-CoA-carboxylase] ligase